MDRRSLIAAGTVALSSVVAQPAAASNSKPSRSSGPALSIAGLGLPVIADGRLRNYVFVSLRLVLGQGKTIEQMRSKEAFFRDALVKAAHRTPFSVAGDWTRLDEARMSSALVSAANSISGPGSITQVEIVAQTPRRQAGMQAS